MYACRDNSSSSTIKAFGMGDLDKVGAGHSCSTQENNKVPGTNVNDASW
jgi:hypothetical protein